MSQPPVGKIEQQCTLCMPKFNVINAQGAVMYELSGPLCVCDIPCIGKSGGTAPRDVTL